MKHSILLLIAMLMVCVAAAEKSPTTFPAVPDQKVLENAHVVTGKVISGAQPEGAASFQALRDLGVKTIISVDGATPDVEGARKFGLRYVHLPIGYDGVDPAEGKAIAKAIEELPGKIYLHCHHGKHRSAAAVAVACVYNGSLKPDQAEAVLKTFGTGLNYKGLWKDALSAKPVDQKELDDLKVAYVETAKIADFTEQMVQLDETFDRLKLVQKAGWKTPADHPDLDPAHEALLVEEHLRESARLESTAKRPEKFRKMLAEGEESVKSLGAILRNKPIDTAAANGKFAEVSASCTSCHKAYRDER